MTERDDTFDLINILDTILQNIKLILLLIVFGALVAFIYDNLRTPRINGKVEIFPIVNHEEFELAQIGYLVDSEINSLNELSNFEQENFSEKFNANNLRENFVSYFLSSSILKNNFINAYNLDGNKNLDLTRKFRIENKVNSSTGFKQYF